MVLMYIPIALADLRMMVSFSGKGMKKESLVYYEVLDWPYPKTHYVDVPLMGLLEPWDFSKVVPFDPAMEEGNFRIVAVEGIQKDSAVIDKLAYSIAGNDAESAFGFARTACASGRAR